ncbi:hypothetical protein CCACVL1_21682 [Corchorus capsularis]|uniref:Uncharacterized protein n=1 Tax=Corchorus capsularis TaxID=210143 RepID=A0A1R3H2G2_COCAP|nr:hypothetical protein CCACVL1_21682 [Corchorus capsularis]
MEGKVRSKLNKGKRREELTEQTVRMNARRQQQQRNQEAEMENERRKR